MKQLDFLRQNFNSTLLIRWAGFGLFGVALIWFGYTPLSELVAFLSNREAVTAYLVNFGLWGPLLLAFGLGLNVFLTIIPGHILMITGGYLYGFWAGLGLNLASAVLASQVMFVMLRWAGRSVASRFVSSRLLHRWDKIAAHQGFFFFLMFFWFPILPSNVMNIGAALGTISFWEFLAANFLGRLPGIALVTLIGSHGLTLTSGQWLWLAGGGAVIYGGGRYAAQRLQAYYFPHKESR